MDHKDYTYDYGSYSVPQMSGYKMSQSSNNGWDIQAFPQFYSSFMLLLCLYIPVPTKSAGQKKRPVMNPNSLFFPPQLVCSPSRGQCLNEGASICQHSSNHKDMRGCQELGAERTCSPQSILFYSNQIQKYRKLDSHVKHPTNSNHVHDTRCWNVSYCKRR